MKVLRYNLILSVVFCSVVFSSVLIPVFKNYKIDTISTSSERGRERIFPKIKTIWEFPKKFDTYLNFVFPFRRYYIYFVNEISYHLYKLSPVTRVILGQDGWMFLAGTNIGIMQGGFMFSDVELRAFQRHYQAKADYVRNQGTKYLLLIAPNREEIYPEYFPQQYKVAMRNRFDQVVEHLQKHTDIDIVYIKPMMLEARKKHEPELLFFKQDSHWNDLGAYYGYYALIQKLQEFFPYLKPVPIENYETHYEEGPDGFVHMMGVPSITGEMAPFLEFEQIDNYKVSPPQYAMFINDEELGLNNKVESIRSTPISGDYSTMIPKVLIYRDSFGARLKKFLIPHVKKAVYVHHKARKFNEKFIKEQAPDIVIDQVLSRTISKTIILKQPHYMRSLKAKK